MYSRSNVNRGTALVLVGFVLIFSWSFVFSGSLPVHGNAGALSQEEQTSLIAGFCYCDEVDGCSGTPDYAGPGCSATILCTKKKWCTDTSQSGTCVFTWSPLSSCLATGPYTCTNFAMDTGICNYTTGKCSIAGALTYPSPCSGTIPTCVG